VNKKNRKRKYELFVWFLFQTAQVIDSWIFVETAGGVHQGLAVFHEQVHKSVRAHGQRW